MEQIMTIVEGLVAKDKWGILVDAYKAANKADGLRYSFLLQDAKNPTDWKIIGIWSDIMALDKMRSMETPKAVVMFREAGTEPSFRQFNLKWQL